MRNSKLSELAGDDVLATACLLGGVAIDASVQQSQKLMGKRQSGCDWRSLCVVSARAGISVVLQKGQ
jgi:hypothetical protein